ncbi:MAG: hypothetical protein NTX03_07540 [Bacteroidetes bacterium]|nr:hypothetical protein [Bacteroidota bacterium]
MAKATEQKTETDFFDKADAWLAPKSKLILVINLLLVFVFGGMLFDGRLSFATDDSTYIQNAVSFLKNNAFPSFQGPLYPFFLAVLIKFIGVKFLTFKFFSLIFLVLSNFFLFKALEKRVPYTILFLCLFVVPFNAYILAYGSSTFTEAMFMMFQSLAIWVFFGLMDKLKATDNDIKSTILQWLALGFVFFLLSITRSVAIFAILAVIVFFLIHKQWKNASMATSSFLIFKGIYEVIVRSLYKDTSSKQAELLLRRDYNDPTKGSIDFGDLMDRFFENFGNYFSIHSFKMLGLRGKGIPSLFTFNKVQEIQNPDLKMESSMGYGILFVILFGAALFYAYKYNKYLFFIFLYVITLSFITFAALQSFWNQDRLMVIYLPFIFLAFVFGIYGFLKHRGMSFLAPISFGFGVLMLLLQFGTTATNLSKNSSYYKKYMKGDLYYGYPEQVSSFLKVASYGAKNINDTLRIACFKPIEAAAFTGEIKFTKIPKFTSGEPDSLLAMMRKSKAGYLLTDQFGPDLSPVIKNISIKYPNRIKELYRDEETGLAVLYKIDVIQ